MTKFTIVAAAVAAVVGFLANTTAIYDGVCNHVLRCSLETIADRPPAVVPPVVFVCEGGIVTTDNGLIKCHLPEQGPSTETASVER